MYGNAITKIMYRLVHIIANYSAMKKFKQETKWIILKLMMHILCLLNLRSVALTCKPEKIICQITEDVMGMSLQTMHGYVHIIANFSAINDLIQKANDSFNSSHIGVLFTTYQKKGSNIWAIWII